ncbi:Fpg/Nei family DNA glycosylase [Nesterenkonia lutea]|uniref:DNA-(apurinic or apyrimidinic site) lyase n=1 Tax=Nesterenkonia lutea TaxID=272919 RepID=A0ABR9JD18_9MICC|nr:Fpg/Nei family DNA glycosylase [Nesterenkonia lutea]MBE1523825.1 endonuclease-8 [Nesterenkonia lutea]
MPEGHTLHRLAAQVNAVFSGSPWRVSSPQGRFAAGALRLDAEVPRHAEAWGKHLFVHLDTRIWHVHLGLYGAFSFRGDSSFAAPPSIGAPRAWTAELRPRYDDDGWLIPEPPQGAVRARVQARHGWADLRGPATCAVLEPGEHALILARLGPDPLRQAPDTSATAERERFLENLARRRMSIAAALMEQAVIAGVGNIYRAESLFLESIAPETPSNELSASRAAALWDRLSQQLRTGVREGLIRTLRTEGDRRHWVYQHQGTACLRCGELIAARELQGRRLYWCPGCQLR